MTIPLPWFNSAIGRILGSVPKGKRPAPPVQKKRSWFPRSLKVTREGWWFMGTLLAVGLAAINTGNNLLYLVVATLLSLIVISGVMSESTLKRLSATRSGKLPALYKNRPASLRIAVNKRGGLLSSYSFTVKEFPTEGVETGEGYCLRLTPNETKELFIEYRFTRRGLVGLPGIKLSTSFPFGLFVKGKSVRCETEALVYPMVRAVTEELAIERRAALKATAKGTTTKSSRGFGAELHSIREYGPGDSARHIFWKSAAGPGPLLVKEYEAEREEQVVILFDNFSEPERPGAEELFENLVDKTAGYAAHFIRLGYSVGLKTLSGDIAPGAGAAQLHLLLRTLALITSVDSSKAPAVRVVEV
ncbi:MAG: DUF58 domain-containing protein [Proteobacteria bacterium]|nr:DUF58 domain-containing protein [Pseudomonadota bacterium]